MSHGSILTQQARYRSRCTGRGHQSEHQFLSTNRPASPIAKVTHEQALLEAALFERIDGIFDYCAHPAGIQWVDPRTDHLTVCLDPYLGRPDRPLPLHSLAGLLPTHYIGTEETPEGPGGVPGLRLLSIDEHGLHLGMIGSSASATLTGPTPDLWRTLLDEHRSWCRENELAPLWNTAGLSEPETSYRAEHPHWHSILADSAWLGSGLLRRIGLFHTAVSPFCLRYWFDGVDWKFELKYEHGVALDHDELVALLTHPSWGLPLRVHYRHCECRPCDCDGGRERICWIELAPHGQRRGGISFRFRSTARGRDHTAVHAKLVSSGAPKPWLERALPQHHRQISETVTV
ncbi:hypothetical protein ACFQ2B_00360 [Streptomyces stramineus]|uniref:Uncharacterized protein n=1 Tax=Streptomyces stramineus TaxID=173861 RepID=A0ABN0ZDK2_9ACTN